MFASSGAFCKPKPDTFDKTGTVTVSGGTVNVPALTTKCTSVDLTTSPLTAKTGTSYVPS